MSAPLIVGISGATGAIYGIEALRALKELGQPAHLIVSEMGQRAIAVHGKENLAASDEGVALWRKLCRDAVRGKAPHVLPGPANGGFTEPLGSYAQDTLFKLPAPDDIEADREFLRQVGRQVTDVVTDGDLVGARDRAGAIRKRLKTIEKEFQKADD